MSTKADKQQLIMNLYGLATKLGEAAQKSIDFATGALECVASEVETNGPKAKVVELGVAALKAGTDAVRVVNETSMAAIELVEELEDEGEDQEKDDA